MRRPLLSALVLIVIGSVGITVQAQSTLYVSPDVPTNPDGPPTYLPWEVIRHAHGAAIPYALELSLPGTPAIDALHKMDAPGSWLFSVEAPNDLAGSLAVAAEPRDVIRLDGGGLFSFFFDGSCVAPPVPVTSTIDAMSMPAGDASDLVVSFDVPTTVGALTFQPSELVRWNRVGPGSCGWSLGGTVFDAAGIGLYFPGSTNVTGAAFAGGEWIVAFDVPVDLAPPAGPVSTPGNIVSTDGVMWNHVFDDLHTEGVPGWPISSLVDALSCQANPGRIDSPNDQILLDKSLPSIDIICPGSCSSGGESYGIYQGTIGSLLVGLYDHVAAGCAATCAGTNTFVPAAADSYYLVVPHNHKEEGSFGVDSSGIERPQAAGLGNRCVVVQNLVPCP